MDGQSLWRLRTGKQRSLAQLPTWESDLAIVTFNLQNEPLEENHVSLYFDGLLPDSDIIRKRVAARFKTGSIKAFDLLAAVGWDCVGALQLLPEGISPVERERLTASWLMTRISSDTYWT